MAPSEDAIALTGGGKPCLSEGMRQKMNTPGKPLKAPAIAGHAIPRQVSFVKAEEATPAQRAAMDLYLECCRQVVLEEDFGIHVLVMPGCPEPTTVYCPSEEEAIGRALERLTGREVADGDMVVVLGDPVLDGNLSEDQMLELALADMASHIDRLWPIADRSTGWLGRHIGWAAVAGVMAGAHAVLRLMESADAVMERIKDAAGKGIVTEALHRIGEERQCQLTARPALEAVENICDTAIETHGEYLNLPAAGRVIAEAAKTLFLDAVDSMVAAPRALV